MKTKGSKSVPTKKPKASKTKEAGPPELAKLLELPALPPKQTSRKKNSGTPAEGCPPEVTLENGTTLILQNPADAPAPPKPMRRSSKDPKTTFGTTFAPDEVPDWARRAEARDTATEMAAVPETARTPTTELPTAAPAPKKGRAFKAPKAKPALTADGAAKPGSLRAIGNGWIESLRVAGHTPSTISSYGNDLEVAYEFLDANTAAAEISETQIAAFNTSKGVVKTKTGKPKAKPTILKTRRALRLALVWAEQKGLIKKAPYSAA